MALPPPLQNPHTNYKHWMHGTAGQFYDEDHPSQESEEPGGHLMAPDRYENVYGQYASEHWNTDLGVHFTSRHTTAQQFAGHGRGVQSRIAHCRLHIGNPKHYDSEHDMTQHAIDWAHDNGFHWLPKEHREDTEIDEHLDNHGEFHDFFGDEENHYRLQHVSEFITSRHLNQKMLSIDRGNKERGEFGEYYLALHPDRTEITEGFKKHLERQGHDGITYGNEHEFPRKHLCAIAFEPHQIHMDRWEWLHDKSPHHDPTHGPQRAYQHETLVSPNYTPSEGRHWVNDLGEKVGVLTGFMAEQLYRQPKPEHQPAPEGLSDEERLAHSDEQFAHDRRWRHEVRRALSRGDLSPQEAWNNGYKGRGHDERDQGAYYSDTDRHNLGWEPLPHTLYHVTTNKAGVLSNNTLKSRVELGQRGGMGLGGGDDDTISFTDDPEVAHHIHRALHEYHAVLNGKKTVPDMMEEARQQGFLHHVVKGNYAAHKDWKDGDPYPMGLSEGLKGRRVLHGVLMDTTEEIKRKHPGAEPVEGVGHIDTPRGRIYQAHSVPMTDDEKMEWASSHYKYHAALREYYGDGRMDPGFIMNDPKSLAGAHPSQFAILRCHPKPGAHGYRVSALGEWRTADGSGVHIGGLEPPLHGGVSKQANRLAEVAQAAQRYADSLPRCSGCGQAYHPDDPEGHLHDHWTAKEAKQGSSYLPNPYHTGQFEQEWFHGTKKDFGGDPAPAMHGHAAPSKGMGGPQTNQLLGVHFTPLHNVAHGFAGDGYSRGRIYHARLKMANPIHFEDEGHLLQHVWRWADASHPGFHENTDNANNQWHYDTTTHKTSEEDQQYGHNRRGAPWRFNVHSHMETLLQFHPEQHQIAQGYVDHLRKAGFDGITYGNNLEGPRYHHCAIAFDPEQIEVTHVDRMHPQGKGHPAWPDKTKAEWVPQEGEVEHGHIRSIHGEPEDMLREIERYHNHGVSKDDPGVRWYREDRGNTGRGDFKFHQGAKQGIALRKFYHVAPEHIRKSIERHGLDHTKGYSPWEGTSIDFPKGNYLFADIEEAQRHQRFMDRQELDEFGSQEARKHDLYEVMHPGLGIEKDPLWGPNVQSSFYSTESIAPEHIRRIGMGQRGDLPTYISHNVTIGGPWSKVIAYDGLGGKTIGQLFWHPESHEVENVWVHPEYRRRGVATYLWEKAKEADRHIQHSTALTPEGKEWVEKTSAYQREHEWLPRNRGVFGPGKGTVDPRLFDAKGVMHPEVRQVIMDRLDAALDEQYPDWRNWSRAYLAGSEASEWWGGNDFDTLVGVHYQRFRKAHPEQADLSDDEISQHITSLFRASYNDEDWVAPWDGQVWHITGYVNPDSWDIRKIKPYAAYNMSNDTWMVHSPHVGEDWGPEHWDESVWDEAEAYLAAVNAIERNPDPRERARRGAALYEALHGGRRQAFGPQGSGWKDPFNVVWKFLEYHPTEPVAKLVRWTREAKMQGAAA